MKLNVDLRGLDPALLKLASEVLEQIDIEVRKNADIVVDCKAGELLSISGDKNNISVTYSRKNELFRALSHISAFVEYGIDISERAKYSMLCYMADASRNAVCNVQTAKKMLRYLALMGYDSMMLYTEDTMELPEFKYFGYMRGRFSEAEIREIDDYAYSLGIELIPCVQTLAHLATALRWPDFNGYKDTADILMVGDERTYAFIRSLIAQCAKCFRSRKINIGMDEAHSIACGEYLKRNGYRKPSDVMVEHLKRVVEICSELGFSPMMWSDMFFRMAFGGKYNIREGEIPLDVVNKVPAEVDLIYWDYYSFDPAVVSHMIDCHNKFKNSTVFAGGAWKWHGFGAQNRYSLKSSEMQLDKCEERGIDRIIVTGWGDNGGEASQFSNLATLLYFAERDYSEKVDFSALDRRATACFELSYDDLLAFDLPDNMPGNGPDNISYPTNPSKYLLYNDPLERFMDHHFDRDTASEAYAKHAERLMALASNEKFGYAFETLGRLCSILSVKCDLGCRIYEAYSSSDKDLLAYIAETQLPELMQKLRLFIDTFRKQWYFENKTFGFTTQDIRLGGLIERLRSVKLRLDAYLAGEISVIEELEAPSLPMQPHNDGRYISYNNWSSTVSAGIL